MSKYRYKPHRNGYLVFAYGEHVGQADRVEHRVDSIALTRNAADFRSTFRVGWRPSNEHQTLPMVRTRRLAAEALWEAYNARIREGRY
jgi:hypothetical protein